MPVLARHMLRPNPSIQAAHDRSESILKLRTASHVLTIDSEQQTGTWQFNQQAWYIDPMQMQEALDRCEYAIRHQQEEIARLRAVVERQDEELKQLLAWIDGDSDSLVVLQRTYMDPRISTSDRIKAVALL